MAQSARRIALTVLRGALESDAYANRLLDSLFERETLARPRDKALATELTYGVLRHLRVLDFYLAQLSDRPLAKLDAPVLHLLRLGLYQLMFLDRVPDHAAVSETVELAPGNARGFVNALLRRYLREADTLQKPEYLTNPLARLALQHSVPDWLAARMQEDLDQDASGVAAGLTLESLLAWHRSPALLTLRVNTMKGTRDDLLSALAEAGVGAHAGRFAPEAVALDAPTPVASLPGFSEGRMVVQDEGSMLVSHLLSPGPGERILDIGAAPGGKTTHIGQLTKNKGKIVAVDSNAEKLPLIQESAVRLGLTCIGSALGDATTPSKHLREGSFKRVLLDAPCSALGVIRRHPELPWRRKAEDIPRMAEIQAALLAESCRYVAPGGILVYSVCTTTREEGPQQVKNFLARHHSFVVDPPPPLPDVTWPRTTPEGFLAFAGIEGLDGFFAARLRRVR